MTQLPKSLSLSWLANGTLRMKGFNRDSRYVAIGERTGEMKALLLDIYASAQQVSGLPRGKPELGKSVRIRWASRSKTLRFYGDPNFETSEDRRTHELRSRLAELYAEGLPAKDLSAKLRSEARAVMESGMPRSINVSWREDGTVAISGPGAPVLFVSPEGEAIEIRSLLEDIYSDTVQSDGMPEDRPEPDRYWRMRWLKGEAVLRFYRRGHPNFEIDLCERTSKLRSMLAKLYAEALPAKELTAKLRAEQDAQDQALADELMEMTQ